MLQDMHLDIQQFLNFYPSPVGCAQPLSPPSPPFMPISQPSPYVDSCPEKQQILLLASCSFKPPNPCHPPASCPTAQKSLRRTEPSQHSPMVASKKSAKQATAKYRQRRKQYQEQLQAQVQALQSQLHGIQSQLSQTKNSLLLKLQSSLNSSSSSSHSASHSQNAQIFAELEACLPKPGESEELADLDKINLLLNMLKYRIGPTGRERHAKIQYNFKNVVNTMFPGLARYLLITAKQSRDIFSPSTQPQPPSWTHQLLTTLSLTPLQKQQLMAFQPCLQQMHTHTMQKISVLHSIKMRIKDEALLMEGNEDQMRDLLTVVQGGILAGFCERNKYRKVIALDSKFRGKGAGTSIEQEMDELLQDRLGRKRVKRSHGEQ